MFKTTNKREKTIDCDGIICHIWQWIPNFDNTNSANSEKKYLTIRLYWRRASIQDGQAFTSAWWRHCS